VPRSSQTRLGLASEQPGTCTGPPRLTPPQGAEQEARMNAFVPPGYLSFNDAIDRVAEITALAREPARPAAHDDTYPEPTQPGTAKGIFAKEAAAIEQRLLAKEELRKLLYAEQIPSVVITEDGPCHPAPGSIWGGKQWNEALRYDRITFQDSRYVSACVSGRPIIPREALEAAFNPDGTMKEPPEKEPEPVVSESVDQEPGNHSNSGRPPVWPREVWLECLLILSLRNEINSRTDSQESIAEALATEVESVTGKKPSIDTVKKDWLRPILKKVRKGDNPSD